MASDMSDAIRQLIQDRGISEELVLKTIENTLLAAYKRRFGNVDNAIVRFNDDRTEVAIYAQKKIVDGVYDPVAEIDLEEARELNPEAEIGDELLIEVDPKDFDRISVQSAKQTAHQSIREIQKDSLYSEYQEKVGEIIIGYYQRERNGTIYVDLGKVEGILPRKFQSPREVYHLNDRIKALIVEVNKAPTGLQVVLSRTHTDFVRAIFELEVPEVYDKTVEIHKIVREAGYRTKLAVYSNRDDVDPVGACVGLKGVRIQSVIRELEGEKIDILKYDPDPRRFIKNALSPAEVREIVILDEGKHQALAIVPESQLSLAIGKQGLNVRLANRLVDWNIDVKTEGQYAEMDIASDSKRAVSQLFNDDRYEEEIARISDLPDVDQNVAEALLENGIEYIEDFLALDEAQTALLKGITAEQLQALRAIIEENVEIVEEGEYGSEGAETEVAAEAESETESGSAEAESEVEEFDCPECGAKITVEMTSCPSCGIGLSFEYEDEE
ncbi:MAG: transcription termination/antitermination protein NusA [Treponema sp. GWB1_62_6]|nr:MAG: transcription termination/antitermination protein NusA [Treponema sp. GWB1_62_6]OHE67430.1 MAG: transcription termination/antitermination protein NusA [Treponema sp. GWC1_61_84]OHE76777.1 MAG: transcription termination/antitermination protein NusA [Treponema sp. RIFOXYC1_FULL_61_9]HCM28369.1 transcription termination/antitermination protein NusA [Treponema sp.]